MRRLLTLLALSAAAGPLAARADGSIQLAARAGVARPFGDVGNGQHLSDSISWAFPLEGQLQFRLGKQVSAGAYARWAATSAASACSGCTASDLGLGVLGEYRFGDKLEGGPWIGVHLGYEQLETDVPNAAGATTSSTFSGLEGGASAGVDFELGAVTLGPYVQLTLGQFSRVSAAGSSESIASKGMHGFFGGGVRLSLLL